ADPLVPPDLARALAEVELEISRLKGQLASTDEDIGSYQARIEHTFAREQERLAMTRDYGVTHHHDQTLLDRTVPAQPAQSPAGRRKGERFRVLAPANLPDAPSRPNRRLLIVAGIVGSLGLAILLPILFGQLDASFHMADELAAYSLPVFAVISQ